MELNGVLAPVPMALTDDGATISEIRLLRMLKKLQELGVSGFVACTEVGEGAAVSFSDRKGMLELIVRVTADAPVLSDVTTCSTTASLDLAQHAQRHGARAVLLSPPPYGRYTDDEVFQHLKVVAQYAALPVIVVDPMRRLDMGLNERIAAVTGLFPATPTAWAERFDGPSVGAASHDFAFDLAVCSALALLVPASSLLSAHPDDLEPLHRFVTAHGAARTAKAAFEVRGLDLGPLRGPMLSLAGPAMSELAALLGA